MRQRSQIIVQLDVSVSSKVHQLLAKTWRAGEGSVPMTIDTVAGRLVPISYCPLGERDKHSKYLRYSWECRLEGMRHVKSADNLTPGRGNPKLPGDSPS